ncbi:DUF1810 domain-containing protein [Radicibacter daui]|uniref:DUF1810 domain-containing protein n=1 Tax=Radicibacter daui TaxID=3064829 RepID=UPI00404704ED
MTDQDPFDLNRFIAAQAGTYETALREITAGRKTSHWIWFVFPQLCGLGRSTMAQHYGLASLEETRAYLDHPVLGARLRQCIETLIRLEHLSAHDILGSPDDIKLRSSLTLFALAAPEEPLFDAALTKYFHGERDPITLARLR